jgi:ubiquinone/menaquinone biosynthesis C-methylase UbiE
MAELEELKARVAELEKAKEAAKGPIRLDIGCGKTKQEGWVGIDVIAFDGVDHVMNAGTERWPFEDGSVDEAKASHFLEHLKPDERIHFVNELFRVLKFGGKCQVIVPHWGSTRAYGDMTHQWPPVVEFWFYYLNKEWRAVNAPHNDKYTCDFDSSWGYSTHPMLNTRSQEFQQWALQFYREAAQDLMAMIVKTERPKKEEVKAA